MSKKLLQINPVLRINTSTGRIMQEIGELAIANDWESYIAYSKGRDGLMTCQSNLIPVGGKLSVAWHGVMTRIFDRHGLASNDATHRFIAEIERLKPDVVHIHNIHGYFLNYKILFNYLASTDVKVVWTVHDCWLYTGHCYYYSFIGCDRWKFGCHHCPQKKLFPASFFADRSAKNYEDKRLAFTSIPKNRLTIVPVSHWMKSEMEESFMKDYNFRVIHNGINTDTFSIQDGSKARERYGIDPKKKIILGIASIWSKEKGLDDFIAMAKLTAPDELIVLVGVDDKTKKLLPNNIIAINRTANISQLAELYSAADVMVNPTWQDNYPTVNLEAISCGTPVATYRTGGSIESITDATGAVVAQGDVAGLLKAARELMNRNKQEMQKTCRTYALEHFKKEDRYADYIKLYEEITSK